MKFNRSVYSVAAAATLGAAALAMSGAAQAGDVYWSVGVASPGVRVGVASAPPVIYQPPVVVQHYPAPYPVYQTYPVVVQPRPVIYQQPVVVYPQPRYVAPVQWSPPGRGWGHERGRGHGHERYAQVRYEREGHGGRGGHRD
ncbi:MAG: hypothetical protein KJ852_08585 [Gammaproteobacteria bacterium]|jgi:hypothetical protein|nr:hypothetical protein [Gammaproteobacteria bacterium]MBU0785546.1 hypothetical protein [Gammaproteobacteria bacterium]MBU0816834.1 hypothetical protein [Gammaproteobacteria bacterium]MBU1786998.1 hypothetical protein [Gammaproteobacteria bacterium]